MGVHKAHSAKQLRPAVPLSVKVFPHLRLDVSRGRRSASREKVPTADRIGLFDREGFQLRSDTLTQVEARIILQ